MPLVRITMPEGLASSQRSALSDGVHRALVEVAKAPADDKFQILEAGRPESIVFTPSYLGLAHHAPLVVIQVFMNVGRTVEVKKALYARIGENLAGGAGLRKEDILVNLVEVPKENWSFGGGLMSYPPS